jgi:hypothetical protein
MTKSSVHWMRTHDSSCLTVLRDGIVAQWAGSSWGSRHDRNNARDSRDEQSRDNGAS